MTPAGMKQVALASSCGDVNMFESCWFLRTQPFARSLDAAVAILYPAADWGHQDWPRTLMDTKQVQQAREPWWSSAENE